MTHSSFVDLKSPLIYTKDNRIIRYWNSFSSPSQTRLGQIPLGCILQLERKAFITRSEKSEFTPAGMRNDERMILLLMKKYRQLSANPEIWNASIEAHGKESSTNRALPAERRFAFWDHDQKQLHNLVITLDGENLMICWKVLDGFVIERKVVGSLEVKGIWGLRWL